MRGDDLIHSLGQYPASRAMTTSLKGAAQGCDEGGMGCHVKGAGHDGKVR